MMKKLWSVLLLVCLLLACCAPAYAIDQHPPEYYEQQIQLLVDNLEKWYEDEYGEGALVAPFEQTQKLTVVGYYDSTLEANMATWNEWWGETLENNRYTEAIRRALNIDIEYKWLVNSANNGYATKLRLEMAAGELPDMFLVTDQTDLMQLAEAGLIMPVDEVVEQYATTIDKDIQNSDGGMLYEMATAGGKVYGIPCNISDTDTFSYIWLRKDWMDALGLTAPKTMEELKALMQAFMKADFDGNGADDTFGMLVDSSLYYPTRGLFAGFNAYPEFWVKDGDSVVWGGTQGTVKDALRFLNELYNEGFLDPEFITQSNNDAIANVLSGHCGVLYAGHWVPHSLQNLWLEDPQSEWICVELPSADGAPVTQYLTPVKRGWIAINADCKIPQAATMIRALCTFCSRSGVVDGTWWFSNDSAQVLEPFQASVSSWDNYNTYLNLLECFAAGGDTSVLRGKAITYWGNLHSSSEWAWMHMFGDGPYTPMVVLGNAINEERLQYDAFLGAQSEFMQDRWSTIKDEQRTAFTKMIIGAVDIDGGFDAWLLSFSSMGGDRITEEVNEWYQSR